jgi:hypothetical protein
MTEIYIQQKIVNILKNTCLIVMDEVPVLTRCADIVYRNDQNELISIEVKLADWKKAIKQAKDHSLVVDRAYICLPEPKQKDVFLKKIKKYLGDASIGLLFYSEINGEECLKQIIEADKNQRCWRASRVILEKYLYA